MMLHTRSGIRNSVIAADPPDSGFASMDQNVSVLFTQPPTAMGLRSKALSPPPPHGGMFCLYVPFIPLGRRGLGTHSVPTASHCWVLDRQRSCAQRKGAPSRGCCKGPLAPAGCSLVHQVTSLEGQSTGGILKEQSAVSPTKGTYWRPWARNTKVLQGTPPVLGHSP